MDVNDKNASPHYHALEGQSILHVDWKLSFPAVDLLCYNCMHALGTKEHLMHDRTPDARQDKLLQEQTTLPYLDQFGFTYVVRRNELQV